MKKVFFLILLIIFICFLPGTSANQEAPLNISILEFEGQARLQRDIPWWQFWKYTPLSPYDYLIEGDRVQTLSRTHLLLEFPDESLVWIGPGSLFQIKTVSEKGEEKNSLYMSRGTLGARIIHLLEGIITFEVETPSAVAAIRGTEFFLEVTREKTIIMVSKGRVVFSSEGVEVLVGAGEAKEAIKGEAPTSTSPTITIEKIISGDSKDSGGMPDIIREKLRRKIPGHPVADG